MILVLICSIQAHKLFHNSFIRSGHVDPIRFIRLWAKEKLNLKILNYFFNVKLVVEIIYTDLGFRTVFHVRLFKRIILIKTYCIHKSSEILYFLSLQIDMALTLESRA